MDDGLTFPSNDGEDICNDGVDNDNDGQIDEGCGGNQPSACVGKPIDLGSGNMFLSHTDFAIKTGAMPINFKRTYNSQYHPWLEHRASRLGHGWRHNFQAELIPPRPNTTGTRSWYKVLIGSKTLSFSRSGSTFTPQRGALGYTLEEKTNHWELTSPDGMHYHFDRYNPTNISPPALDTNSYRRLTKIVAPNGNYLELRYQSWNSIPDQNGYKFEHLRFLRSITPRFSDGTSAGKSVVLKYTPYDGNWRINEIYLAADGSTQCSPSVTCANGESCVYTLYHLNSGGSPSSYGQEHGICATTSEKLVTYTYTGGAVGSVFTSTVTSGALLGDLLYKSYSPGSGSGGSSGGGGTGGGSIAVSARFYIPNVTVYKHNASKQFFRQIKSTMALLTKAERSSSHFYTYEYDASKDPSGNRKLTKASKGTGTALIVLEEHEYDLEGRAITSKSQDEDLTIDYSDFKSNNQIKVTRKAGGGTTETTQIYTLNTNNRLVNQSGPCDCDMTDKEATWDVQQQYSLPLSIKQNKDTTPDSYTNYAYEWHPTTNRMFSKKETIGATQSGPSASSLEVTTYYHPKYPDLPIAIRTPSVDLNGFHFKETIYDYDAQADWCSNIETCAVNINKSTTPTSANFNNNPTSQVHRILVRGYTKRIGSSAWVIEARETKLFYDSYGRLIRTEGPRTGQQTEYIYYPGSATNINNRHRIHEIRTTVTDPRVGVGTSTHSTFFDDYNIFGAPGKITRPNGSIEITEFDSTGRVTKVKKDHRTQASDDYNTYAGVWEWQRNDAGEITAIIRPNGSKWLFSFDGFGRTTHIKFQENGSSSSLDILSYTYNDAGQLTKTLASQPKDSQNGALKSETRYTYNSSNDAKIVKRYPSLPKGGFHEYKYNPNGTLKQRTDENGKVTEYTYDGYRKWVTKITRYINSNPVEITFTYNKRGQRTSVTDSRGITTQYEYDDFGNRIKIISPDRAPSATPLLFEYDKSDNLIKKKRPDLSQNITYQYDSLNRRISITYPAPQTGSNAYLTANDVEYFYDESGHTFAKGKLTRVTTKLFKDAGTDVIRTVKYDYDASGNITQKRVDEGGPVWTTTFKYDKENNKVEVTYPFSGKVFKYEYNQANQFTRLLQADPSGIDVPMFHSEYLRADATNGPGGVLSREKHDNAYVTAGGTPTLNTSTSAQTSHTNNGAIVKFNGMDTSDSNGIATLPGSTYLASGPIVDTNLQGHTGLISRKYEHDKTGLITSYSCLNGISGGDGCFPGNQSTTYSYDGLYRLTTSGSESFVYDSNGNMLQRTKGTVTDILEYSATSNHIERIYPLGFPGFAGNYVHDVAGRRSEDQYYRYIYHMNGRLAVMEPKSINYGSTVVFAYDHMGRRVRKMTFASGLSYYDSVNYFFGLDGKQLESYNSSSAGNSYRSWIWVGSRMIAGEMSKSEGTNTTYQLYMYHHDHLGRPVVVTNKEGIPVWRSQANAFGRDMGYGLKDDPYKNVTLLTTNHIKNLGYSSGYSSQTRTIIEPGTFGVQFKFKTLDVRTSWDELSIYSRTTSLGNDLLHTFTGNHQTGEDGNTTNPFWGPVIQFRPKEIGNAGSMGDLLFELYSGYGSVSSSNGYEITDYRLWYVPNGDVTTTNHNDTPPLTSGVYANSENWEKVYNAPTQAKLTRVCFDSFEVEAHYDKLEIRDSNENIIQVLSGEGLGAFCSTWVQGNVIKLRFKTDGSVTRAGFVVSRIESLTTPEIQARFPGQWYEKETAALGPGGNITYAGLSYNWNRFYDCEIGRYITPDPIGLDGGMNIYAYAEKDPNNKFDSDGKKALLRFGLVGLGLWLSHVIFCYFYPDQKYICRNEKKYIEQLEKDRTPKGCLTKRTFEKARCKMSFIQDRKLNPQDPQGCRKRNQGCRAKAEKNYNCCLRATCTPTTVFPKINIKGQSVGSMKSGIINYSKALRDLSNGKNPTK